MRVGVLVPARDEGRAIADKVRDLARCAWPDVAARGPHAVVIVDDHSSDDTFAAASAAAGVLRERGLDVHVVRSAAPAGKPGAIRAGLARLCDLGFEGAADLVVLTDADVAFEPGALVALAQAFAREPRLGMACGAQRYVACAPWALECGDAPSDMGLYDRLFALARRCESMLGALLSVHGQLLAWRAGLALAPPDGRAADDLELVVAARDRARPPRVRLIPTAQFFERRAGDGAASDAQRLRRARAWFQHFAGAPPRRRGLRVQWHAWRLLPLVALALSAPLALVSKPVALRRGAWLAARRAEREGPMPARWEVARG
ncbi:MAG: glycosyltransferase [Planctomycetota bacterium]